MSEWFDDDAFWEAFYPAMFHTARWDSSADEAAAILALTDIPVRGRVLDICCGPGRHAVALAERGYEVVGVDRTASYLARAQAHAERQGVDVTFVEADARTYASDDPFDLVISFFTSFGYFQDPTEDIRFLRNIHALLRPGGKLLMDMSGREVVKRHFQRQTWSELEDGSVVLEDHTPFDDWGGIENVWILRRGEARVEKRFKVRLYSAEQLTGALEQSGFTHIELFGNLDAEPYDDRARRLVARAER